MEDKLNLNRLEGESRFDWKFRLGRAKVNKEIKEDWKDIVKVLGLNKGADAYRHDVYAWMEMYSNSKNDDLVHTRVLSISDLHIPFQLPLSTYKDCVGYDVIQINGDALDCQSLSKFPKSYRISPVEEMIVARQYFIDLINMIKPKMVLVNHGNHELRMGAYLNKNIDTELKELMPETAFDYIFNDGFTHYSRENGTKIKYEPLCDMFEDVKIEYSGKWYSQYGDILFCHPRAYASNPLKTAEKALYWFRNEGFNFKALVMAHTHRVGSYKIGNSMIYEQGACCDIDKMSYGDGRLVNSQKQGFMTLALDKDGCLIESKTRVLSLN